MNTESINPIIQKARWIAAKLQHQGQRCLSNDEKVFIAELSRRASVCGDHTARRLVSQIQAAYLDYQLKLST
jgi:hypothetical protein